MSNAIKAVVDCASGETVYSTLTDAEQASLDALQQQSVQEATRAAVGAHEEEWERAQAILNLMASPSVAADPALAQALSYILGA